MNKPERQLTCGVFHLIFLVFLVYSHLRIAAALQCYRGHLNLGFLELLNCSQSNSMQDVGINATYLYHKNTEMRDVTHCIIVLTSGSTGSAEPEFWCDYAHRCSSDELPHDVLTNITTPYKGLEGDVICCNSSLCNSIDKVKSHTVQQSEGELYCYQNKTYGKAAEPVFCYTGHCRVIYEVDSAGNVTNQSYPQYHCDGIGTNALCHKNNLEVSGCAQTEPSKKVCCCRDSHCNLPGVSPDDFVSTHLSPGQPMPGPAAQDPNMLHWKVITSIAGGVVAFALLVIVVATVIIKCRQRRDDYMSYIYSQLTSDLVDDSPTDDDMLEP